MHRSFLLANKLGNLAFKPFVRSQGRKKNGFLGVVCKKTSLPDQLRFFDGKNRLFLAARGILRSRLWRPGAGGNGVKEDWPRGGVIEKAGRVARHVIQGNYFRGSARIPIPKHYRKNAPPSLRGGQSPPKPSPALHFLF